MTLVRVEARKVPWVDEMWSGDRAVLTRVVELYEGAGEEFEPEQVLEAFPDEQHDAVRHSLRRLGTHGYIETLTRGPTMGVPSAQILMNKGVTERALREVGAWPDNAELLADRILAVLAEGAENEPEPEKRSESQAGLRGFGGMTRDVLVGGPRDRPHEVSGPQLTRLAPLTRSATASAAHWAHWAGPFG